MLRYFYVIVCVQVCFCSVYVDNSDYEVLDRRVRCRVTKLDKKQTRSPRKSRVVQFDVEKFVKAADSPALGDRTHYAYRNKKRQNRLLSTHNADYVEPREVTRGKTYSAGFNTRSPNKYQNPRHFNFHSLAFEDKNVKVSNDNKKATSSFKQNKLMADGKIVNDPEKKCSFRNMKIPFFSRNKVTAKTKRHKKRRIFCFNCVKKTSTSTPLISQTDNSAVVKTDDPNKDAPAPPIPSTDDKGNTRVKVSKVSKRAYDQLCPKCIRELLMNLKKKTTKKVSQSSTASSKTESKSTSKKRTQKQKADLSESLQEGYLNTGSERLKRNENEDQDRERRLKELEEVEKKIENVHIVTSSFTRN